jgi:deazaflavin-dependent oxidoreductase (nitroreductase family)
MRTQSLRTRIEHELDTRSVPVAVWLYRKTSGRIAKLWRRRVLVMTTTGRRPGAPRTVPVQYFVDGPDLVVVAANSGLQRPPGWYFNLRATPQAVVEIGSRTVNVRAEELDTEDAAAFWPHVLASAPDYERFPERTGRTPHMFRLVPQRD